MKPGNLHANARCQILRETEDKRLARGLWLCAFLFLTVAFLPDL